MNEVVWSVNIFLGIGLIGVAFILYKIIIIANEESNSSNHNHTEMLDKRRPQPKRQPPEVIRFIRRPCKKGRKLFFAP
jgi:hypothetical protein